MPAHAGQVAPGMRFTYGTHATQEPGTVSLEGIGLVSDRGCVCVTGLAVKAGNTLSDSIACVSSLKHCPTDIRLVWRLILDQQPHQRSGRLEQSGAWYVSMW